MTEAEIIRARIKELQRMLAALQESRRTLEKAKMAK
jgi:prefoldin subunit 5